MRFAGWVLIFGGSILAAVGMMTHSAAEHANRVELYRWITGRLRGAKAARALLAGPDRILGASAALASVGLLLTALGIGAQVYPLPPGGVLVVLLAAIPLLVTAIDLLPRAIGRRRAEGVVKTMVPWIGRLANIFAPFVPVGSAVRPRIDLGDVPPTIEAAGSDAHELTLVSGVLAFSERPVREVMTPRTELVAVKHGASVEDVGKLLAESGYSRLPVYSESLDNIVGMLYAFDLFKLSPGAEVPLRPVTIVPGTRPCADLLFEMQRDRRHLAVVLDEYGGTAGIATMEDLLGELVGEIEEAETDSETEQKTLGVIEVSGATPTEEIAERFDAQLPDYAETVSGLLTRAAGRIPQPGERYEIGSLEFDVMAATPTRVERVAIRYGPVPTVRLSTGDTP